MAKAANAATDKRELDTRLEDPLGGGGEGGGEGGRTWLSVKNCRSHNEVK